LELEQLQEHQAGFDREQKFLQGKITQADGHIKVVSDQLDKDEQGLAADAQDVQGLKELAGKGLLSMPRMADARRAVLLSSTRKLQTASQLMKLESDRLDLSRQGQRLNEQRKSDLLRDLQDRNVRLNEIRARLESIEEKLRYTGILKSQLVSGTGDTPDITVVRKTKKGREHITADEDYELEPGDVVEIALRRRPLDLSSAK
jgi:polysaccharide export outer membrane protein